MLNKSKERLIVALDFNNIKDAKHLVNELGDSVLFYKIGLELFMTGEYFNFINWLKTNDKKVFADLKFFDVPETVKRAVKSLSRYNVDFTTIHGNDAIMKSASESKGNIKLLAVTALTSLDQGDLTDLGFKCDVKELVLSRAKRAIENGCDGVVSSGLEIVDLRKEIDKKLLIVTPGIRPVENVMIDDQKRIIDVETAFLNGTDYIVIGRPIRDAENPQEKVIEIQEQIKHSMEKRFARQHCNEMLYSLLGESVVDDWWKRSNKAFDNKTPETIWDSNYKSVYDYLLYCAMK